MWIKPFVFNSDQQKALKNSKLGGIVLDDDYEEGVASSIAHQIMLKTHTPVCTMALKPRSAAFHPDVDNLPPSKEEIIKKVLLLLSEKESASEL